MRLSFPSLLLGLFLCFQAAYAADTPSKLNKVTVFRTGAQIERTSTVNISAGTQDITFTGLSRDINQESIQVKGEGSFTIMGVRFQNNFLQSGQKPAHQIGLEADLAKAKAKLVEYNYEMDILRAEERMLDKNQQLISSNNATELKAAMDFHKERLTAIRKSMLQNFGKSDELKNQITDIENQIKELGTKGREMTGEIIVTIKSE